MADVTKRSHVKLKCRRVFSSFHNTEKILTSPTVNICTKMTVNLLKTVELVFRRPNISNDLLPSLISDVRRVGAAKLLGVHLTQNLCHSTDAVVTVCNQRLYLLAQLKRQGLDLSALDSVFNAIIANKILCASPVYYGYLTQGQ